MFNRFIFSICSDTYLLLCMLKAILSIGEIFTHGYLIYLYIGQAFIDQYVTNLYVQQKVTHVHAINNFMHWSDIY